MFCKIRFPITGNCVWGDFEFYGGRWTAKDTTLHCNNSGEIVGLLDIREWNSTGEVEYEFEMTHAVWNVFILKSKFIKEAEVDTVLGERGIV